MAPDTDVSSERLEHHQHTILTVATCTSDKTGLSGSEEGQVILFSLQDGTVISSLSPGPDPVNCVTFNPRETAKFYTAAGETITAYDKRKLCEVYAVYKVHDEEVNQVAIDEKGQYFVSCDDDGEVACVDIKSSTRKCVSKHTVHDNICASVQWVPNRTGEVVSGGMDCKIHHRDLYKTRPLKTLAESMEQQGTHIINPPFVNCIATHWNSRYMVAGYGSGTVKVWRLGSKKMGYVPFKSLPEHNAGTGCVSLADPTTVVSGGNDGFLHVSDLESRHTNGNGASAPAGSDGEHNEANPATLKIFHGHKINWLSATRNSDSFTFYVADETSVLTKYSIR